jgi:large subunit ribosomal protein L6
MSRVGKKPIPIPAGVQVKLENNSIRVKGSKGEMVRRFEDGIDVKVEDGRILLSRRFEDRAHRALHGLLRSDIHNMVIGVTTGYQKTLEITGVGFRAQIQGRNLTLALGYSHPTVFALPAGIDASVEKQTVITVKGSNKYLVGQVASEIRDLRLPEPYKGKGIKYAGEVIERKEGKTSK